MVAQHTNDTLGGMIVVEIQRNSSAIHDYANVSIFEDSF